MEKNHRRGWSRSGPALGRLLRLAILCLPAACVTPAPPSAPGAPAWVNGPDPQYPEDQYLLMRARAAAAAEADDRARAELARPFVLRLDPDGGSGTAGNGGAPRRLIALSDRIVEQVRVAGRWIDPRDRTHLSLAVLPRSIAADSLREQIAARDADIRQAIDQSGHGDLLQRIRQLDVAVQRQVERDALQRLLATVSPRSAAIDAPGSAARLRADRDALFGQVRLQPQAAAGSVPGLEEAVAEALARRGHPVGDAPGDYLLLVRLVLADDLAGEGTIRQHGVLEVTLIERAGERVRGSRRWLIRTSAPERGLAVRRALGEVTGLVTRHLRELLLEAGGG
jgi:hypothetical protein